MTDLSETNRRPASFLPHDGEELQGQAPPDACTLRLACENADRVIHQVLLEQRREENRNNLPPIAPSSVAGRDGTPRAGADDPSYLSNAAEEGIFQPDSRPSAKPRWLERAKGINLTRRRIVLLALVGFVIWWPMLVLIVLFTVIMGLVITYLTLGHDRFAEIARKRWARFVRRRPKRAARLRQKADALALSWDKVLDWLPERWADRLALPDFAQTQEPQINLDEAPDPYERLAARSKQG